jgi:hypothetical protein
LDIKKEKEGVEEAERKESSVSITQLRRRATLGPTGPLCFQR